MSFFTEKLSRSQGHLQTLALWGLLFLRVPLTPLLLFTPQGPYMYLHYQLHLCRSNPGLTQGWHTNPPTLIAEAPA